MITSVAITIIIVYLLLIGLFVYGFDKVEDFKLQDLEAKTKFSIAIPFRNEANHLTQLLESISKLNYPKNRFEVILINDESTDNSVKIIEKVLDTESFKKNFTQTDAIKIIPNNRVSKSPKKDAINSAISIAKHEWIITTDADCVLPKYWLDTFDELIQTNILNCVVAPVTYNKQHSFFYRFQTLDVLSLQGATIAGFGINKPFLCNGANFAYRKSVFKALNGFDGNTDIASGDDVFLLEKFVTKDAKKVKYIKSTKAVVKTVPVSNFRALIQQRLRWASKTSKNPNLFSKFIGVLVFLTNLLCVLMIPLVIFKILAIKIAIALFVIKWSIDFLLLFKTSRFFKQETLLLSYIFSSILYPFFSSYIVILSLFKSYKWKDRAFRK